MNPHASTSRRSRLRHGVAALALLPLLLVLAGCFRLDVGLTINEDDTLDVAMEIADVTGIASRDDMDCSQLESEMVGGEQGVDFAVADIEDDDGNVGCRITATGAPLDTLADDGGMSVQRAEDTYVFTFEGDDAAGMQDLGDFEDMPAGMQPQVSMAVTFPGSVIEADGEIDGNTATWTGMDVLATGGTATGEATGSVFEGDSGTLVWVILGIVVLLVLAALIFFIVKRNRSGSGGAGAAEAAGGAPYGAPGYGASPTAHHPGRPEGGFGPADQVPSDPGAGYPGQQPPAAPSAFTTAVADTPVQRPEGESFAPPEPAAPEPQSAPPHGVPDESAQTDQVSDDQHGNDGPRGDQPR